MAPPPWFGCLLRNRALIASLKTADIAVEMRTRLASDQHAKDPPAAPNAAFDALARMVAHEVRNALSPLRVAAQSAQSSPDAEASRLADRVVAAVDRVSILTDALLERRVGDAASCDVRPLVEDVAEACSTGNVRVRCSFANHRGPLEIRTHEAALRHILANLVANAVRASSTAGGAVEISAKRSTWNNAGDTRKGLRISVRDHGPGFPPAALQRLNTPCELDEPAESGSGGVGLEVVRRLAAMIGARLEAHNEPDGGACVSIETPHLAESASIAA